MKDKQLSSILVLSFALGLLAPIELLVQSLPEGVFFDPTLRVKTEAELFAAVADVRVSKIVLQNDIVLVANLEINRELTLDLHGFNLTGLKPKLAVVDVKTGKVTITGKGSIVAYGPDSVAVRIKGAVTAENSNYAYVMIDEKVKLFAPNYYGVLVIPNFHSAYGVTVDFRGSMVARDGICIHGDIRGQSANAPQIKIAGSANLVVDETFGTALCAFGYGSWEIGAAEIAGARGIAARAGRLTLSGTKIMATGAFDQASVSPLFGATDATQPTPSTEHPNLGSVLQIEDQPATTGAVQVTIKDGEYISAQSYVFSEVGHGEASVNALELLNLESGTFAGQMGIFYGLAPHSAENAATVIYGGQFNSDVTNYLAPGHHLERDRKRGIYAVVNENPIEELDDGARLARAEGKLHALLERANEYLTGDFASGNLGDWQTRANRSLASLKRAVTLSKKSLRGTTDLDKLTAAVRMLERALENLQSIADDLRAELASVIASVKSVDPEDYTSYSYRQVVAAVDQSMHALRQDATSLETLYAALVEIEINLDLLEVRGEDETELEDLAPLDLPELPEPNFPASTKTLLSAPELPPDVQCDEPVENPVENSQDMALVQNITPVQSESTEPDLAATPNTPELSPEFSAAIAPLAVAGLLRLAETLPSEEPLETSTESPAELVPQTNSNVSPVASQPVPQDPETLNAVANLRNLLNAISVLNPSDYTPSSFAILAETTARAGELLAHATAYDLNAFTTAFANVNFAYSSLVKKSVAPSTTALEEARLNLSAMLDAVQNLTVNDYEPHQAEQFGELQVAIARANALLARPNFALTELIAIMDDITAATTGLKISSNESVSEETVASEVVAVPETPLTAAAQVDWSALQEVVADIAVLNPSDYTATSYAKLLAELERAKALISDPNTTQAIAEDMTFDLNLALLGLEALPNATPVQSVRPDEITNPTVAPNLLMSMMAGAYAGLATYRKSRLAAKKRKQYSI